MDEHSLELSAQVTKGRYANLSSPGTELHQIFMMGYEECTPDYRIERNEFPFWTLEYVASGAGVYLEGQHRRPIRHGAVFTYGPKIGHCFWNESDRPFKKYFIASSSDAFPVAWREAGLLPGKMLQVGNGVPFVSIFDQMLDEGVCADTQSPQIVTNLEQVLLAQIIRHRGTARGDKSGSRKVYDLSMDILQKDYRRLNSLTDLAKCSGYSGEYLCRIFKKYHGESPYQVLLHRKMSAAWLLLRDGRLQVSAVARELGYQDPLHFSRTFRKIMGCAPSSVHQRMENGV